jgi:fatty acid synthase
MTWEEAHHRCPDGVFPACHNSHDSITVAGPAAAISEFVTKLRTEGIFATEVDSVGGAFHSPWASVAAPILRPRLQEVRKSFQ